MSKQFNKDEVDLSTQILCSFCKNVFTNPVTLPCKKSVCKSHVQESLKEQADQTLFECTICEKKHHLDDDGCFPLNKEIDDLVKKCQVRATPIKEIHKSAHESYNKLTGMIEEFKSINDESDLFIYNYFSELERKVDLKRDILIEEIHTISDKLREDIAVQKMEIQSKSEARKKKLALDREQLIEYQKQLDIYNKELKEYSIDLDKWKNVQTETEKKREELKVMIKDLKSDLFCDRSITFKEGNAKINSKELFGEIVVEKTIDIGDKNFLELYEESYKIDFPLYQMTSCNHCYTIGSSGYINQFKTHMIDVLGFSEQLANKLIENSTEENLPTCLKAQFLRNVYKNELMNLKVDYG